MANDTLHRFVEYIMDEGGSDLHLGEGRKPIIRVDNALIPISKENELTRETMKGILSDIIPEDSKELFEENKEVDFSYAPKEGIRFRANAYIQQSKLCLALRLIPQEIKPLEELGLPEDIRSFAHKKQGFFLVVGPTGHGKSTTLASLIDLINKERAEHIMTIEDPIEYVFTPKKSIIDQREIRADATDFYSALRSMFRQDADVLMIGEMRSPETMATAVTAAETGHMVFSTLHTNTAAQTIERIIDSFASAQQDQIRMQLAGSLAGIFSQRLIPRVSGGLIPAYELLIANNAVSNLIREKRTHEIDTVIETSSSEGMITLNASLASLVKNGEITIDNAFLNSVNQKTLEKLL